MKAKHWVIIAVVLLVLAGIAAVVTSIMANRKNSDPNYKVGGSNSTSSGPSTSSGSATTTSGTSAPAPVDRDKKVGLGSKGAEVETIQRDYNASKYMSTPLVVDGIFGAKTLNAIIKVMGFGTQKVSVNEFEAKLAAATAGTGDGAKSFFSMFGYNLF